MQIKPFFIDKYPVTNAEFKKFLDTNALSPKDSLNSSKTGKMVLSRRMGQQTGDLGIALKTPVSMQNGLVNGFPTSGSGSTPRRVTMAAFSWGNCDWLAASRGGGPSGCPADNTTLAPTPDKGRHDASREVMLMRIPGASPFGVMDMWATYGSGPTSILMTTRPAPLFAEVSLSAARLNVVLPEAYKNEQHGKTSAHGSQLRSLRHGRLRCVKDAQ